MYWILTTLDGQRLMWVTVTSLRDSLVLFVMHCNLLAVCQFWWHIGEGKKIKLRKHMKDSNNNRAKASTARRQRKAWDSAQDQCQIYHNPSAIWTTLNFVVLESSESLWREATWPGDWNALRERCGTDRVQQECWGWLSRYTRLAR